MTKQEPKLVAPQEPAVSPIAEIPKLTTEPTVQQPINGQSSGLTPRKSRLRKAIIWIVASILTFLAASGLTAFVWYNIQIAPIGTDKQKLVVVKVESGSTPQQIGLLLQSQSVIRSGLAFDIYTRLTNKRNILQAGTYRLSPAESTPEIVERLVKGDVDQFSITFLPGATLKDNRKVLIDAGYTASEVDTALAATYDSPLFANKPVSADLEGYIYAETYKFNSGATVSDILIRTFAQFDSVIKDKDLVASFAKQKLNLFQGITLASIIQREANSVADRRQVAQVFYLRLQQGMSLGSDVTYQYIADKTGVPRDPGLDSPYNTRVKTGLPPGPIATPGLSALEAVANPASGDYVYFLSGDDNITYFARTNAEHEANIRDRCKVKCSTL